MQFQIDAIQAIEAYERALAIAHEIGHPDAQADAQPVAQIRRRMAGRPDRFSSRRFVGPGPVSPHHIGLLPSLLTGSTCRPEPSRRVSWRNTEILRHRLQRPGRGAQGHRVL